MEKLNKEMCHCCDGTGIVEGEHYDDRQSCLTCNGKGYFEWKTPNDMSDKAKKYLLDIKFDDAHLPELFNDDDKSYYTIPELMQSYAEQHLEDVFGDKETIEEMAHDYCFENYSGLKNNTDHIKEQGFLDGVEWLLNLLKQRKG